MKHNLHYILFESETYLMELALGVITFLFGIWVLSPFWDTFGIAKSFDLMKQWGDSPSTAKILWGAAFVIVAVLKFIGTIGRHYRVRLFAIACACTLWLYAGVSFLLSNFPSTGTPIFIAFGFMHLFLLFYRGQG